MPKYRVVGSAHGAEFDEGGFSTLEEAQDYASSVIDGDLDGTVEIEAESDRCPECGTRVDVDGYCVDAGCRNVGKTVR